MQFEARPLVGIGPVLLGQRRDAVRRAIGAAPHEFLKSPTALYPTDAFYDSSFQVFYRDESGPTVEFIELSRVPAMHVIVRGLDVFSRPADEVVAHISKEVAPDPHDPEYGYSYIFPAWELALWRPTIPAHASDDDGRYFSTIGIGVTGYFTARAG